VRFIRSIFFTPVFFQVLGGLATLSLLAYWFGWLLPVVKVSFLFFVILTIVDILILFVKPVGVSVVRHLPERLSNGDANTINLNVRNGYSFTVAVEVIDEIPAQFQERSFSLTLRLQPGEARHLNYALRPVKRGEYHFGVVNLLVQSPFRLACRRTKQEQPQMVPVYPSFVQMRKYELLAISNRLVDSGIKRIRRIGNNREFEQIKHYVAGDDFRTVNWKATARRADLMVNSYQEERSQQVYMVIDKGRTMQMPFEGMTLLDYAINASLAIANIAMKKSDKAGLITFQDRVNTVLPASRINNQLMHLMEALYSQKTSFREPDFSALYSVVRRKITQRSLLLLFTNFETEYGVKRQLGYLSNLARQHVVVVIFFENTEMRQLLDEPASTLEEVFHKAVAEKFSFEKRLIVRELQKNGVYALLTTPAKLTINTINMYLELKARGVI
jgi:uncharacterized protein (DUF58 family)